MMGEFYRDLEYPVGVQRQQAMLVLPNQIISTKLNIYDSNPYMGFVGRKQSQLLVPAGGRQLRQGLGSRS